MNEAKAKEIMLKYLKTDNLIKHSLETGAVLRGLAKHFGENEEFWAVCGILHDIDLEIIGTDYSKHGPHSIELLKKEGVEDPVMFQAILSHAENLGFVKEKRTSNLDYALAAGENITGLIAAYVLILPSKKLADVKPSSILKRLKEKSFAAKVNRELISDIEKTGLMKDKFVEIAVNAMKGIAAEIGF